MADVRLLYDKDYISSFHLQGRDWTVEIVRVKGGELNNGKSKTKKPIVYFKGTDKGLALNITNAKTIAQLYGGFDTDLWIGKKITLYPTTTSFGSQTVDCIRIRPKKPAGAAQTIDTTVQPPAGDPRAGEGLDVPLTADDIGGFGGDR